MDFGLLYLRMTAALWREIGRTGPEGSARATARPQRAQLCCASSEDAAADAAAKVKGA